MMCVLIKMGLCMLVTIPVIRYLFISSYCTIINVYCHALIGFFLTCYIKG